ncbi:RND family efflux transporter MFP subunit [Salinisphaera dokdonensis CL-ES53]|uniref:RND family efflux transporter MFP subunit n=1 Tax=Salinisphaera dokdonensis CL-ES53 TaxID=1304272 RepID=A0ABV2AYK8_9GAMM
MTRRSALVAIGACIAVALLLVVVYGMPTETGPGAATQTGRVAVETQTARLADIEDIREYSGSLEPSAQFTVAPKIAGRIEAVAVDIGDEVASGDTLITLDDQEYRQALAEAEARLQVARAQYEQARSDARTANRSRERVRSLNAKGIAATAELDAAEAEAANANAAQSVARASIAEAKAQVETARIRLGYTEIRANWPEADNRRRVGERIVEPGDTVAANTPLLRIVSVRPLTAVIQVPEALYPLLSVGQSARLRVAGAESAAFEAEITRIAPIFDPETRRARVELTAPNDEGRLAPGMFVQVGLVAERLDDALVVPRSALVSRDGRDGVFVVNTEQTTARFVPAEIAFTRGEQAALRSPAALDGPVVTLGQAQLEDGIGVALDDSADTTADAPGDA